MRARRADGRSGSRNPTRRLAPRLRRGGSHLGKRRLSLEALEPRQLLAVVPAGVDNLMITEINYWPYTPTPQEEGLGFSDKEAFEFIELRNLSAADTVDLTGVRFEPQGAGDIEFSFTGQSITQLAPGHDVVVVANQDAFQVRYGSLDGVAGQWSGNLGDGGDRLLLRDAGGQAFLNFRYKQGGGWPGRADGDGATLELIDPQEALAQTGGNRTTYLEDDDSWRSSSRFGGTPGAPADEPITSIVVNEALTHTDFPQSDTIELYNTTDQRINLGGWFLSDDDPDDNYAKFRIPDDTFIEPFGYLTFDEWDFNPNGLWHPGGNEAEIDEEHDFALSSYDGDHVWLMKGDGLSVTHFVDHVSFDAAVNGESFGRWPNATGDLYPMQEFTPGAANSGPRVGPVILSELMYNPPGPVEETQEFVEIFNPFRTSLSLAELRGEVVFGWRLRGEVDFDFTPGTSIPAHSAAVIVPFDPSTDTDSLTAFRTAYSIGPEVQIIGGYDVDPETGQREGELLDNGGATVRLDDWDEPPLDETDPAPITEDEVEYDDDPPWPTTPDAEGDSLHREDARLWGHDRESWMAAPPSPGSVPNFSPWAEDDLYRIKPGETLIESFEGVLQNDNDPNGDGLTANLGNPPTHGQLTRFLSDGSLTYVPQPGYHGWDSFTYTAVDTFGLTDEATVFIAVNNRPDEVDDEYTVVRGGTLLVDDADGSQGDQSDDSVLLNDEDEDGDPLTALLGLVDDWPEHGRLTFNGDGTFVYTHVEDGSGALTDSFTYRVYDGFRESGKARVTIHIREANTPPDARDDTVTINEDQPVIIEVLRNDEDIDFDPLVVSAVDTTATQGAVIDNGDGTLTYDPAGQFDHLAVGGSTTDTFQYTASDGKGGTDTATVTVTLTGRNDSPTAVDDTAEADEDSPADISAAALLANDNDPDAGDTLTITAVDDSGATGTVSLDGTTITYDPNGQFEHLAVGGSATDTFDYTVSDGHDATHTATVTVQVAGQNDLPVAADDTAETDEDTAAVIDVLANDSDVDGDLLTIQSVTQGSHGSVAIEGDAVRYSPGVNFFGADAFTYTLSDGHGGTDTASVSVTVNPVNDPPEAEDDPATTNEDGTAAMLVTELLDNDFDVDGDLLSVTGVDDTQTIGLVSFDGTSVLYDPNGQFEWLATDQSIPDTFSYTLSDGHGGTDTGTVTVTVTGVNDPPTAVQDAADTDEDTPVDILPATLLANDTDPDDGDVLTVVGVDDVGLTGLVSYDGTTVTYDPDGKFEWLVEGQSRTDTFTYRIGDGHGSTHTATVTLTITGVNDPPTAEDDLVEADEDSPLQIPAGDLLDNDADPDTADALTLTAVDDTASTGTVSLDGTNVIYDPDGRFESLARGQTGTDTFTYTVRDGYGGTASATVTVTVHGRNDAPLAVDESYSIEEGTTLTADDAQGTVGDAGDDGVLANDGDPDGDPLQAVLIADPSHGQLTLEDDGTFVYVPAAGFTGVDSFTYLADDDHTDSNQATVTITVFPAGNHPPTAVDDPDYQVDENGSLTVQAPGVLDNDADLDGESLTARLIQGTSHGTLTLEEDGSFDYTPEAGFHGTDSFRYTAYDGWFESNEATVSITVKATNDAPVTEDDAFDVKEGQTLTAESPGVLENDDDPDDDPLSVVLVAGPAHGTLTLEPDGSFVYEPGAGFNGVDGFTYRANDGSEDSNEGHVTITVVRPLGMVDYLQLTDLDLPAVGWYHFTAWRDGVLTAELVIDDSAQPTQVTLYRDIPGGAMTELASGQRRVDYQEGFGGNDYVVHVDAAVADGKLLLANLLRVSPDGSQLNAFGTTGDDQFEFLAGDSPLLRINAADFEFDGDTVVSVAFDGGSGEDAAVLRGSQAAETFTLRPNSAQFEDGRLQVTAAAVRSVTAYAGSGLDTATLHDSPGDDTCVATPVYGRLFGEGFDSVVWNFAELDAVADHEGYDVAKLYDSPNDDVFHAEPGESRLSGAGFHNRAEGFDAVHAYATAGGIDLAEFFDSPADDHFYGSPLEAALYGAGFYNRAKSFEGVRADAGAGEDFDRAQLHDSSGNDNFVATPTYAALRGVGFGNQAEFFDEVNAYATAGGIDVAMLYDSPGDDTLVAAPTYGGLLGDGFRNQARFFDAVHAYATAGGIDVAKLYDSPGQDQFYGDPIQGALYGDGFYNRAKFFEAVHGYATAGGTDVARLFDSDKDDLLFADPTQTALYNTGFYNRAKHFERVDADASAGGYDRAEMHGSGDDDVFDGGPLCSTLQGPAFSNRAEHFEEVHAYDGGGGEDRAYLHDSALDDLLEAQDDWVRLTYLDLGYLCEVAGFDHVKATGSTGTNKKDLRSLFDIALETAGPWEDL